MNWYLFVYYPKKGITKFFTVSGRVVVVPAQDDSKAYEIFSHISRFSAHKMSIECFCCQIHNIHTFSKKHDIIIY